MKSAVFITVRTDSNRLPDKALLKILGKPAIEMVILRALQVKNVDKVVLCTTKRPIDDELVKIARKNGVKYFRGSLEDKLDRWLEAAKACDINLFATLDGDDLFADPELIATAVEQMKTKGYDFIKSPPGLICGAFT